MFGAEHSGHFYFRDFWYADSGLLAALHLLAALAADDRPVSQLLAEFDPYASSGEINFSTDRAARAIEAVQAHYADEPGIRVDHLDGLTVSARDWWFNIRPSNTEPLLRLNVEGTNSATMAATRDQVTALLRRSM